MDRALMRAEKSQSRSFLIAGLPVTAILFLVLTAVVSLLWSRSSLLTEDEFLSLWTDRLPSLTQVIHVQRTYPISIDPLFYHVAAHTAVRVFGDTPFAMRLPSLVGFLIMEIGLFFFVRTIANEGAAVFALAFPALTSTLSFSLDGRPYGLMLGLVTLTMVSWQAATRRDAKRALWLLTLAVGIALTINVHYFGVLVLIPLLIAELYRAVQRRALDIPVLCAIAAGASGIVGLLPFLKAARVFRAHYCCYPLKLEVIPETYLSMVPHLRGSRMERALDVVLLIAMLLVLWGCFRQLRRRAIALPEAEAVFLLALAMLPFFGYILAWLTKSAMEPRYTLGAFPAIAALLAIGVAPAFREKGRRRAVLAAMFVGIVLAGGRYIHLARRSMAEAMETLKLDPEIEAALAASATGKLYFQDPERFAFASYYEPDAGLRSRIVLVYSPGLELRWNHADTDAFQAMSMRHFTPFDIEPFESISNQGGEFVFTALDQDPQWHWATEALRDAHARVRRVGSAFGVDVVTVQFIPTPDRKDQGGLPALAR